MMDFPSNRSEWPRVTRKAPPCVLSDDPADHGLSLAEVACIERASEVRLRELRKMLEQPAPFKCGSLSSEWSWPTTVREQAKVVLAIPLLLLLAIAVVIMTPLEYVTHRRDVARRKARLREELAGLDRPPFLQPVGGKTVRDLWRAYGLESERFNESVGVELVSWWLDRLYGPETTTAMKLNERLVQVTGRRARLRAESPQIACVLWIPRLEQVIDEVSRELPSYDWAGPGAVRGPSSSLH